MRRSWLTAASALGATIAAEAPVANATLFTNPNPVDFGNVRIGATASENFTLKVNGPVSVHIDAATAPFARGPFDFSRSSKAIFLNQFSFSPTALGAATESVAIGAVDPNTKATQSGSFTLTGTGVGPQYQSNPGAGATIDFGTLAPGADRVEELLIKNASTGPGKMSLTGLTLLEATQIGGPGFSLGNFSAGSVLGKGDSFHLKIDFSSLTPGTETETLEIVTDQGAKFGSIGQVFDYTLTAKVAAPVTAPEPASLGLFASALAGLGIALRRRRQ